MHVAVDRPLLKSLLVLAAVIEARDPFTGGHIWRTSRYAKALAEALGLTRGDAFLAELGALVHDLGKIAVPDTILRKSGHITDRERQVIQRHPEVGHSLVVNHPLADLVAGPVCEHHLRPDGRGYPAAWADRQPSLISRVVSVADAFDAMTSCRPYSAPRAVERAVEVLESERDRQFDGAVVDRFCTLVRQGRLAHVIGHCADNELMLACPDCGPIVVPPRGARDGDSIDCPACTSEFVLHISRDTYELEWTGVRSGIPAIHPDLAAAVEVADQAPPAVDVEG